MDEVKIFARAGQGAITTAAILGEAMFYENKYAYAFPHFGAARMGAPMNAFLRFDDKPIRIRSKIYTPNYIIIVDPTLIDSEKCFSNLPDKAKAIVSVRKKSNLPQVEGVDIYTLPAEEIATEIIGKPYANTVLLGAFAKVSSQVSLENIVKAVEKRFSAKPKILDKNIKAVKKGFESV
jgi:pyruvate ferredoxin oxidoreductase gamma subunit